MGGGVVCHSSGILALIYGSSLGRLRFMSEFRGSPQRELDSGVSGTRRDVSSESAMFEQISRKCQKWERGS
eukprot:5024927-Pyramimonas_sp.AAC.1